jgi:hypothetical protein
MKTKRAMQRLESDLREDKAAAVDAPAAVDRKRKAAADAEDDFNSGILLARHCYGLQRPAKPFSPALMSHPVYSPVDETYRGGDTPSYNPVEYELQGGCETPTYPPTSASYVPQNPNCGCGSMHGSPTGYHPLPGVPQYTASAPKMSPTFTPPGSLRPTYKPTTSTYAPSSHPPHSPHTAAAARSNALKWGG